MKNNKTKLFACVLACALITMPLAACGRASDTSVDKPSSPPAVTLPDGSDSDVGSGETHEPPTAPPTTPEPPAVTPPPQDTAPSVKTVNYILTKTNGLNVRTGPSTSYSSLGAVEKGVLLKYVDKVGDFYKTTYLNRTAYVSASPSYTSIVDFELNDYNDDIERVIDEGLKVLGTKYVYGAKRYHYGNGSLVPGFTVTEFDCSSLMQYIFYKGANELLTMTSREQSLQGVKIDRAKIRRGDLLFFTNESRKNKVGVERIGHVALYLGDNYILHTASDYAKVEQISSKRWGYYEWARRII